MLGTLLLVDLLLSADTSRTPGEIYRTLTALDALRRSERTPAPALESRPRNGTADDDSHWQAGFHIPGTAFITKSLIDHDGYVVAAGHFLGAGSSLASFLARWDGETWTPWRVEPNAAVLALEHYGGRLIVGGDFTQLGDVAAARIAGWDGQAWLPLGVGLNGHVLALAVYGGSLVVGGNFTTAGNVSAAGVAAWDGTTWTALGSGVAGALPIVNALAVYGGELYVGGDFTSAGGQSTPFLARWDGASWTPLGAAPNRPVMALATYADELIVGGAFDGVGFVSASRIAAWNGSQWRALGAGVGGGGYPYVGALGSYGERLAVGGNFQHAGGIVTSGVALWDGTGWHAMGPGVSFPPGSTLVPEVHGLLEFDDRLYVAGYFSSVDADVQRVHNVASWDGARWSALEPGLGVVVDVLTLECTEYNSDLVVAGGFTRAGEVPVGYIARLHNDEWLSLSTGTNDWIYTSTQFGGDLVVGGRFTAAGGVPAARVARWDGSAWWPLGAGLDSDVYALAVYRDTLVAGGVFTGSDGEPINCIAKWDGTRWTSLGLGVDNAVRALAVYDGELIAGGYFELAGGKVVNRIAAWNGSEWRPLSGGVSDGVNALRADGPMLFVGGAFRFVDRTRLPHVARWDGTSWAGIGDGLVYEVLALEIVNGDLYAAGVSTSISQTVSRWTGTTWTSLGSATDQDVHELRLVNGKLAVGGQFFRAGSNRSLGIAVWDPVPVPVALSDLRAMSAAGVIRLAWHLAASGAEATDVRVERAEHPLGPFEPVAGSWDRSRDEMWFDDATARLGVEYWYRVHVHSSDGATATAGPIRAVLENVAGTSLEQPMDRGPDRPIEVRYYIAHDESVELGVYDVRGRLLRTLQRSVHRAGWHSAYWNRITDSGKRAARGVYIVRLNAGSTALSRKLHVLR